MTDPMTHVLLRLEGLKKHFLVRKGLPFFGKPRVLRAVDGIDLAIRKGDTVALVGESGCGKTTLGRTILKLMNPTEGRITYDSVDYTGFDRVRMLPLRKEMQMIFQDPYSSLNPRMSVGSAIGEPLIAHGIERNRRKVRERVMELLHEVGLSPDFYARYPHQMSGGQRQRIGVARALVTNPKLIVCDEPVSALDVSVQAQILNLFKALQRRFNLTYLFITHDLRVAQFIGDQVAVMYLGGIVEMSSSEALFRTPLHPYSKALLSSIPSLEVIDRSHRARVLLAGDVPTPLAIPCGCRFHPRCSGKSDICLVAEPVLAEVAEGHRVACHRVAETKEGPWAATS